MGGANKLLADFDGRTVLERVASAVARAGFSDIVAVTGHQSSAVEQVLSLFDFRVVRNAAFETGMHSSIRRGLEALPVGASSYFAVCLGDQPFLSIDDYSTLIAAAEAFVADAPPELPLIYPVIDGERGQPVLIPTSLRAEILAHADDDRGCAYLFASHPSMPVDLSQSAHALAFYDVDTPEALAHARAMVN